MGIIEWIENNQLVSDCIRLYDFTSVCGYPSYDDIPESDREKIMSKLFDQIKINVKKTIGTLIKMDQFGIVTPVSKTFRRNYLKAIEEHACMGDDEYDGGGK